MDGSAPELRRKTTRLDIVAKPINRFMHLEASSGILLLVCTAVALYCANSGLAQAYEHLWHTPISLGIGSWSFTQSLHFWINEGLMTVFFFVVGLEIKREVLFGELNNPKKVALPLLAACGGAIMPAIIYFMIERGTEGAAGWGIPMATDIAFVVGILSLLGARVPNGLRVFLLTLAIADDLLAIIVIGIFYSSNVSFVALGGALLSVGAMLIMNWLGVRRITAYVPMGGVVWACMLVSGVHPSIAGVLVGLITPGVAWYSRTTYGTTLNVVHRMFERAQESGDEQIQHALVDHMAHVSVEASSPLTRIVNQLHPWVSFGIMPVFALANAGVEIHTDTLGNAVTQAVALGLLLGKPLGIFVISWLTVRLGLGLLPAGVNWRILFGGGILAGIGFTMALFVAMLSFSDFHLLAAAKTGVLVGSALSAILGLSYLFVVLRLPQTKS